MDGGTYLLGTTAVVAIGAALVHGAGAVRRAALPGWTGARGALAQVVVALGLGLAVARVLGAVGLLTGPVVLVAEVGVGLAAGGLARRRTRAPPARAPEPVIGSDAKPSDLITGSEVGAGAQGAGAVRAGEAVPVGAGSWDRSVAGAGSPPADPTAVSPPPEPGAQPGARAVWEWVLAAVPLTVVVLQWVAHTADAVSRGMVHPDTLWYHGPFAARFAQTGGLGALDGVGYEAARWFPLDGQLVHAVGFVLLDGDWLSPFVNLGWLALALLAAWCIGERRRAGPAAVAATSVVLGAPFLAATQPGQMSTDVGCAALLLAAVALVLESGLRPAPLAVAGIAAGLAVGTKVTVVVPVAVLLVAVAALAYARRGGRPVAWWLGPAAAGGAFWFGRSWVLTGSPLPWFTVPGLFDRVTVEGQGPSLLAARQLDGTTWATIYRPGLHQALGPAWPLVLALAAVGATLAARRDRPSVERVAGLLVVAGVVGHLATPLTAGLTFGFNLRYLAPTLLLGAALVPLAVRPGPVGRAVVGGVATALVLAGATAEHVERVAAWPDTTPGAALALAGGAVVAAGAVALARRVAPGMAVAAVVVLALGVGGPVRAAHEEGRYVGAALPPTDVIPEALRQVRDERVALYGSVETYPLFGPDLSNEVEVGSPPPPGPGTVCTRWRSHLADRYDVIVVSRWGFLPLAVPPPAVFAGDPAARLVAGEGDRAVYRIDGALDPTRCPV